MIWHKIASFGFISKTIFVFESLPHCFDGMFRRIISSYMNNITQATQKSSFKEIMKCFMVNKSLKERLKA